MKKSFCAKVESYRDKTDPRFKTDRGDQFGLFRIPSPITGATLRVLVGGGESWHKEGMDGEPWDYVSVSRIDRTPSWEEMVYVKTLFFDDEECVVQYHPPKSRYVNNHPYVLHLWRPCESVIPMPPLECV